MSLFTGGDDFPPFLAWAFVFLLVGLVAIVAFNEWSKSL